MLPTVMKTKAAQAAYLRKHPGAYAKNELRNVTYFLNAYLYKFQLANYSLEQL